MKTFLGFNHLAARFIVNELGLSDKDCVAIQDDYILSITEDGECSYFDLECSGVDFNVKIKRINDIESFIEINIGD